MPNQVSGLAGYYLFLDANTPNEKRLNDVLIAEGASFFADQLDPNTDYTGRIWVQPVDKAGNAGAKVVFVPTSGTLHTLNPTPQQSPMSTADDAAITDIMQRCINAGAGPGLTVAVISPKGYIFKTLGSGTGNDMHFRIASQTKSLCARAVLRFIDQGLIALDTPLETYLPGSGIANASTMTIRHMMMMQSGIYDVQTDQTLAIEVTMNPAMAMTVDQYIAKIKAGPSMFAPGTAYHYTNSNYFMLGKVLEAVDPTHRTADQIIMQDIVTPIGMVNSSFPLATGAPPAPYAIGYANNAILAIFGIIYPQDVSTQNPAFLWTSGAVVSVASDMLKLGEAMRDGLLLSPAMNAQLMSTFSYQPASPRYGLTHTGPPTFGYGLGFVQVGSWFGHDGSWFGYDSCTMFEPVTGTVITVYENFQTAGLLALTTVFYEIAQYLYPGSANNPGYLSSGPSAGTMATTLPKITTAMTGNVYEVGSFQPFTELYAPGALASVTGKPLPDGASGAWVTPTGPGGPGGNGGGNINQSGGSGGGGAGRIKRTWIPRELMGDTFDAQYGLPAAPGAVSGDTVFRSGSVELIARGGKTGVATPAYNTPVAGGLGGTWAATPSEINGVPIEGVNGMPGGNSHMNGGSPGGSDPVNGACAGGGGGGGNVNSGSPGAPGGASKNQPGGLPGAPGQNAADETSPEFGGPGGGGGNGGANYGYNGQPGGTGGKFGAGGGGGGGTWGAGAGAGGRGGTGGVKIEWE